MPPKTVKKVETTKVETAKVEEPVKVDETAKVETPKVEEPVKVEEPKEEPNVETTEGEADGSSNNGDITTVVEEIVSSIEYLSIVSQLIENTKQLANAQKSFEYYTKPELKEIDKASKLLQKAQDQLSKEENKVLFSLAANSAPKVKKVINVDANGVKITEGKNPVNFLPFAQEFFGLPSKEGHGSRYLEYIWAGIKKEEGVKNGSLITINKPGPLKTFFDGIKKVMEDRGLNTDKEKEVYALIETGVLKNKDITKFSKYCYEEKEKKAKVSKKAEAK